MTDLLPELIEAVAKALCEFEGEDWDRERGTAAIYLAAAKDAIEAYESTRTPPDDVVEAAAKAYAEATDYYVPFHSGLSSESADKIRKGVAAALQASDNRLVDAWQPIETAPRDGTEILAIMLDGTRRIVAYGKTRFGDYEWWFAHGGLCDEHGHGKRIPVFWMPLPETPAALKDIGR